MQLPCILATLLGLASFMSALAAVGYLICNAEYTEQLMRYEDIVDAAAVVLLSVNEVKIW